MQRKVERQTCERIGRRKEIRSVVCLWRGIFSCACFWTILISFMKNLQFWKQTKLGATPGRIHLGEKETFCTLWCVRKVVVGWWGGADTWGLHWKVPAESFLPVPCSKNSVELFCSRLWHTSHTSHITMTSTSCSRRLALHFYCVTQGNVWEGPRWTAELFSKEQHATTCHKAILPYKIDCISFGLSPKCYIYLPWPPPKYCHSHSIATANHIITLDGATILS